MRKVTIFVSGNSGFGAKGFKVMVNGIQEGPIVSTAACANKNAIAMKDKHYPQAKIYLMTVTEEVV